MNLLVIERDRNESRILGFLALLIKPRRREDDM